MTFGGSERELGRQFLDMVRGEVRRIARPIPAKNRDRFRQPGRRCRLHRRRRRGPAGIFETDPLIQNAEKESFHSPKAILSQPCFMAHSIPKNNGPCHRHHFLQAAGAATIGRAFIQTAIAAEKEALLMQIGILLGRSRGRRWRRGLDAVKACGLDCVQLSMDCAGLPADARPNRPGACRADSPRGGRPRDRDRFPARHLQHEPSRRRASPRGRAAAGSAGRGLPAAGHVEDPHLHGHARSRQHVAAPSRQRFAGGLARHGRLRPRGGGPSPSQRA